MDIFSHMAVPFFNFALFILILWALIKKPLHIFLATRREVFKARVEDVEKKYENAMARHKDSEDRLFSVDKDLVELKRSMEIQAMRESEEIMRVAGERAEMLYLDAHRQVALEMARLKRDLYNLIVRSSFVRASEKIQSQIAMRGHSETAEASLKIISEGLVQKKAEHNS